LGPFPEKYLVYALQITPDISLELPALGFFEIDMTTLQVLEVRTPRRSTEAAFLPWHLRTDRAVYSIESQRVSKLD
jgi:hypothetical protein